MLYNNLSTYLREKYGKRMKKICIDGGFTCPNRDGKCGTGGCVFCGERGSGDHIDPTLSIKEQAEKALSEATCDDLFIVYFQNFTNTYAPIEVLKERYDSALTDERIKILSIGTRPDCINEDVVKLISEYQKRYEVWVELGLQTANDKTAQRINRGYYRKTFEDAMELLSDYGIKVVVHLIIGLPGETKEDVLNTVAYLSKFDLFGIKLHSLYVMKGTLLEKDYLEKRYTPLTLAEYSDIASDAIAAISPSVILHRITGDAPRDMLVAPEWNRSKSEIIDAVNSALTQKGVRQGDLAPRILRAAHELTRAGFGFTKRVSNVCFVLDTSGLDLSEDTSFVALCAEGDKVTVEDMGETYDAVWSYVDDETFRKIASQHSIDITEGKYLRLSLPYNNIDSIKQFINCLKEIGKA